MSRAHILMGLVSPRSSAHCSIRSSIRCRRSTGWTTAIVSFERAVLKVRPNLDCLPSTGGENPMKIVSSDRFQSLLSMAKSCYDFVVLDSPPALHVADLVVLAKLCQHIVFIVQAGRLPNEMVAEAIRRFSQEDQTKMVTLLTRARKSHINYQGYYSAYGAKS